LIVIQAERRKQPADDEIIRRANRIFSYNHAMSIHLNLIAVVATVWYALALAGKITMMD
jgi:hypothetical protein